MKPKIDCLHVASRRKGRRHSCLRKPCMSLASHTPRHSEFPPPPRARGRERIDTLTWTDTDGIYTRVVTAVLSEPELQNNAAPAKKALSSCVHYTIIHVLQGAAAGCRSCRLQHAAGRASLPPYTLGAQTRCAGRR